MADEATKGPEGNSPEESPESKPTIGDDEAPEAPGVVATPESRESVKAPEPDQAPTSDDDPGYVPVREMTPRTLGLGFLMGIAIMAFVLYLVQEVPCVACAGTGDLRRRDGRDGYIGTTAAVPCSQCLGTGERKRVWDVLGGE